MRIRLFPHLHVARVVCKKREIVDSNDLKRTQVQNSYIGCPYWLASSSRCWAARRRARSEASRRRPERRRAFDSCCASARRAAPTTIRCSPRCAACCWASAAARALRAGAGAPATRQRATRQIVTGQQHTPTKCTTMD
jgi:hypothetical protein